MFGYKVYVAVLCLLFSMTSCAFKCETDMSIEAAAALKE